MTKIRSSAVEQSLLMKQSPGKNKKWNRRFFDFAFYGIILLFLFNPTARSWLMRGALKTGLFSPGISMNQKSDRYVARSLTFRNENGALINTSELKGRVVFINFWASWCPPCIAEMPSLNELYNEFRNDPDFEFLFINLDDTESAAKNYLNKNRFAIPLQRPEGGIPDDLYSGTLPTTVVLNKYGTVVMKHTGLADYMTKKFIQQLKELK